MECEPSETRARSGHDCGIGEVTAGWVDGREGETYVNVSGVIDVDAVFHQQGLQCSRDFELELSHCPFVDGSHRHELMAINSESLALVAYIEGKARVGLGSGQRMVQREVGGDYDPRHSVAVLIGGDEILLEPRQLTGVEVVQVEGGDVH